MFLAQCDNWMTRLCVSCQNNLSKEHTCVITCCFRRSMRVRCCNGARCQYLWNERWCARWLRILFEFVKNVRQRLFRTRGLCIVWSIYFIFCRTRGKSTQVDKRRPKNKPSGFSVTFVYDRVRRARRELFTENEWDVATRQCSVTYGVDCERVGFVVWNGNNKGTSTFHNASGPTSSDHIYISETENDVKKDTFRWYLNAIREYSVLVSFKVLHLTRSSVCALRS